MENKAKIASVKSIITGNTRQSIVKDSISEVEVGDIVLLGYVDNDKFGSFDVGRVEDIKQIGPENEYVGSLYVSIRDVITDSSSIFKGLKHDLRKKFIKEEIDARIKRVDERQRMEMYAKSDSTIAELMKELDSLKE